MKPRTYYIQAYLGDSWEALDTLLDEYAEALTPDQCAKIQRARALCAELLGEMEHNDGKV
jgi:hypothetical protein